MPLCLCCSIVSRPWLKMDVIFEFENFDVLLRVSEKGYNCASTIASTMSVWRDFIYVDVDLHKSSPEKILFTDNFSFSHPYFLSL